MTRPFVLASLALTACTFEGGGIHQPSLADVSVDGDAAVELVDRQSALAGAVEDQAGVAPDLTGAPDAFFLQVGSEDAQAALDNAGARRGAMATYDNALTAAGALVVADLATAAVVGPPALAIAFAADGELTEVEPWLWTATNTATSPDGATATADLNVAWIGVGWLAEMRLTSSDGTFDDTLWFNGFLSIEGALGWWDFYANDTVVGVVEWVVPGDGSYQAGIASLAGDTDGDVLAYSGTADGENAVSYFDASAAFLNYVLLRADQSGEVALVDRDAGAPACWDTTWADAPCD